MKAPPTTLPPGAVRCHKCGYELVVLDDQRTNAKAGKDPWVLCGNCGYYNVLDSAMTAVESFPGRTVPRWSETWY